MACIEDRRVPCSFLVGSPEGKRPLGNLGGRWEDNIKMELKEVACGSLDWVDLD